MDVAIFLLIIFLYSLLFRRLWCFNTYCLHTCLSWFTNVFLCVCKNNRILLREKMLIFTDQRSYNNKNIHVNMRSAVFISSFGRIKAITVMIKSRLLFLCGAARQ